MASGAFAWTQLSNAYPNSPTTCTGTPTWPCIRWPKTPSNLSVNVDVYLASSLVQNIDLRTDVRNSISEYDAVAARNPHLQEITTLTEDVYVGSYGLADGVYAATTVYWQASSPYRITYVNMIFSSAMVWNRSLDFHVSNPEPGTYLYYADARKVANHEMGHAEGLGHTGVSPAIMRTGPTTYYHLQTDDKNGVIAVYGSYP